MLDIDRNLTLLSLNTLVSTGRLPSVSRFATNDTVEHGECC